MIALHLIPAPAPHAAVPELGYWMWTLAAVTLVAAIASLAESLALSAVLWPLWVGVAFLGIFYTVGGSDWEKVGGYVTMASAFTAFYAASTMMLASTFGPVIFPLGKYRRETNKPGGQTPTRSSLRWANRASNRVSRDLAGESGSTLTC